MILFYFIIHFFSFSFLGFHVKFFYIYIYSQKFACFHAFLKSISNVLHCVCALYIIENEEGKGNTTHVHGS